MHVNDLLKIAVDKRRVRPAPQGRQLPDDARQRHARRRSPKRSGSITRTPSRWRARSCRRRSAQKFKDTQEVDLAYSVPGLGRFRCNVFQQRGTDRPGPPRHPDQDPDHRRARAAAGAQEDRRRRARPGPRHRHDRQRQEHDARGDDRPHQRDALGAHHDDRGPDRVPAPRQPVDRQPARDRRRHAVVRARAAQRAAPGPRRHPGRRNARLSRRSRRRCSPPRPATWCSRRCTRSTRPRRSTASSRCSRRTSRSRSACSWPAVLKAVDLAAPDAARRRQRAARRRSKCMIATAFIRDCIVDKDKTHLIHGAIAAGHVAVRDADVRPVDLQPLPAGPRHARRSAALGVATSTSSS